MPERLDDLNFVRKHDPSKMWDLTTGFPHQCREALEIASKTDLPGGLSGKSNIVLAGMGGSAAGGDLLKALLESYSGVPCTVVRDYTIPKFVSDKTLFFACSYSGNTEETMSATELAKQAGANIVCITSGGRLSEFAEENELPIITIPGGQPPRTALGYLFLPAVWVVARLGYIPEPDFEGAISVLEQCRDQWAPESPQSKNPTKSLALRLFGRIPIIYGLGGWQGYVAQRWKSQINENAKIMAFAHVFPEMNHNEIVGWTLADRQNAAHWATVILESGTESKKMIARAQITMDIIRDKTEIYTAFARGERMLAQMLSLTYFGDFVSMYLAALYETDPEKIDSIVKLKNALADIV